MQTISFLSGVIDRLIDKRVSRQIDSFSQVPNLIDARIVIEFQFCILGILLLLLQTSIDRSNIHSRVAYAQLRIAYIEDSCMVYHLVD